MHLKRCIHKTMARKTGDKQAFAIVRSPKLNKTVIKGPLFFYYEKQGIIVPY